MHRGCINWVSHYVTPLSNARQALTSLGWSSLQKAHRLRTLKSSGRSCANADHALHLEKARSSLQKAVLAAQKHDSSLKPHPSLTWNTQNPQFMLGVHGKMHLDSAPLGILYMDKLDFDRAVGEGQKFLHTIRKPPGTRTYLPLIYTSEPRWECLKRLFTTDVAAGLAWSVALILFQQHQEGGAVTRHERDAALRRAIRQVIGDWIGLD